MGLGSGLGSTLKSRERGVRKSMWALESVAGTPIYDKEFRGEGEVIVSLVPGVTGSGGLLLGHVPSFILSMS